MQNIPNRIAQDCSVPVVLESRVNGITGEPGKLREIVWEKIAIGTPFIRKIVCNTEYS